VLDFQILHLFTFVAIRSSSGVARICQRGVPWRARGAPAYNWVWGRSPQRGLRAELLVRGVARNLIWVGINGSRRQNNHIKIKVDWFEGYIYRYTPVATPLPLVSEEQWDEAENLLAFQRPMEAAHLPILCISQTQKISTTAADTVNKMSFVW